MHILWSSISLLCMVSGISVTAAEQKYEISVVEKKATAGGQTEPSNWLLTIVALTFLLFIILLVRAILRYHNKSFHPLSIALEYGRRFYNFCRDFLQRRRQQCNHVDSDVCKEMEYLLRENTTDAFSCLQMSDPINHIPSPCGTTSSSSSVGTPFESDSEMPAAGLAEELLSAKIVYRTLYRAMGGVIIQPGVNYTIRGYFLSEPQSSGFRFVTITPLRQHWHINFEDNLTVMELIEPIALDPEPFNRYYRNSRAVAEAADLSTMARYPCINTLLQ